MDSQHLNKTVTASPSKKALHVFAASMITLFLAPAVHSLPLTIDDAPLFLSTAVSPNVFFEIDDSGSMDWEILTVKHWRACDYDRDAKNDEWGFAGDTCASSQRDDGLWFVWTGDGDDAASFEYIYVNSDNSYDQDCNDDRETLFSCGNNLATNEPYQSDWRIFSSDFNVLFYNPAEAYTPWTGPCLTNDTACADASFSSAKSDPRQGKDGYTATKNLDGFIYEVWIDTAGYSGSQPERGGDINDTATANNEIDLWDKHLTYKISGNSIIVTTTTYSPNSSGLNATTTSTKTLSGSDTLDGRTIAEVKTNIANWYSYYRKRSFIAKAGLSAVLDKKPTFRYGLDTINEASAFVEMPATVGDYTSHNNDLLEALYDTVWPAEGTPLRRGLERAGEYYDGELSGKDSPILDTCQKNYAVLVTDGYWNGSNPSVGNADGDGHNNTVADVAKYYHNIDFDTNLDNEVPADACDPGNIRCDTEPRQHMVTYTLAFGVEGNLVDTSNNDWPDPALAESGDWGNPYIDDSPEKIDDLWHAAWNSYGKYINVSTPGEAVKGLSDTIADVDNRRGAASSVALNSGFIGAGANIYQALFNGEDWSGELKAIPIFSSGVVGQSIVQGTPVIRASVVMPAASARTILTHNGTDGVAFQWDQLSASQQAVLDPNESDASAASNDTLDYIRGDTTNEADGSGSFRIRPKTTVIENNTTVAIKPLGDIINSSPAFAGAPQARYPDVWSGTAPENCNNCETYTAFKAANVNRTPMVYVGTNGGYLSGFHADTLVEQVAYVPATVIKNLNALTDPDYTHQYYVDGSPTVIDAFFQGDDSWHTVLVSGLNNGGQGIFALDVTDPSTFSESGTAPGATVLWEFSDSDDADLGYTYSRPAIVRMSNGQWAAVFGNGYNNRDSDGNRNNDSATGGNAYLYIVNIEDGSLIRKIDTGVGSKGTPNGLATPAVIDTNGDFIADFVYAGDLKGNLWKFDVTSADPTLWDVAFFNNATPPKAKPLYVAKDSSGTKQPITTRPVIGRGPSGVNLMVYFGTGIYLGLPDLTNTSTQTFYGILDTGSRFTGRSKLIEQTVEFQNNNQRTTSENNQTSTSKGWYMDLPDSGERQITNSILRSGRIIFVTAIPDSDLCSAGGNSWLMELDALTGTVPLIPPFDINNDGVFTVADYIDTDDDDANDAVVDGVKFGGLVSTPGIITDSATGSEGKITSDSSGNLVITRESLGARVGRQSWGQLR